MEDVRLGKYKHFKGGEYEVIGLGEHTETQEKLVIYKQLYDSEDYKKGHIWIRALEMFLSYKIFDNGSRVKRFEYVDDKE